MLELSANSEEVEDRAGQFRLATFAAKFLQVRRGHMSEMRSDRKVAIRIDRFSKRVGDIGFHEGRESGGLAVTGWNFARLQSEVVFRGLVGYRLMDCWRLKTLQSGIVRTGILRLARRLDCRYPTPGACALLKS
jgi:hypothetical protein